MVVCALVKVQNVNILMDKFRDHENKTIPLLRYILYTL